MDQDHEATTMRARCEVELDIFSGRPNPTWVLTEQETEAFTRQLDMLPRTPARQFSTPLGYRGFIVQCQEERVQRSIQVQRGTVQIGSGSAGEFALDTDRGFERWLLATGKAHLPPEVFKIAEREFW